MMDLYELLRERLAGIKKLAVLGAGSVLMADDAAGVMIADKIKEQFDEDKSSCLRVYIGDTAPENLTGEIRRFHPCHLIILDAADMGEEPGSVMLIDPEIIGGISFSTHLLPLKIMADYLKKEINCGITFLGIQQKDITYGGEVTPEVREAVEEVTGILLKAINDFLLGKEDVNA